MKYRRRTGFHRRIKAAPGAYSDRYGPRSLRPPARTLPPSTEADPWVKAWPASGLTAVVVHPAGMAFRRP